MEPESRTASPEALAVIEPLQESSLSAAFRCPADLPEIHNFDLSDTNDQYRYINAVSGEAKQLADMVGGTVSVECYYAKPVEFEAGPKDTRYQPGELIRAVRMILVSPNGEQFATTSPTAIKTIAAVKATPLGAGKFSPPLRFKVGKVRTRGGYDTLTLTLDLSPPVAKPAK